MKRLFSFIICIIIMLTFCACSKNTESAPTQAVTTPTQAVTDDSIFPLDGSGSQIIGTWVCEEINEECYFIFESNGDAFAKWGTSTIYGYFDYYSDEHLYDIDIPNFLCNEYKALFNGDTMTLSSDDSKFVFQKATMPTITIKSPDNLKIDKKLVGNWQSTDSFQFYEFRADGTAAIQDIYNYAIIESKYGCKDGVVTFYAMASKDNDNVTQMQYKFTDDGKLDLGGYIYESVTAN